jgi:hypothetical protein
MPVSAEKVSIPVFLNYPQLQFLMKRAMFREPDNSARFVFDTDGCNTVSFSQPQLSGHGEGMSLRAATLAVIGAPATGGCMTITRWAGQIVVKAKPLLVKSRPLSVQFQVEAVELYDQQGGVLSDHLLPPAYKAQIYQVLGRLRMDLKPATDHLKAVLPYVAPRQTANRLTAMIDSLRIDQVRVQPKGLDVQLMLDVQKPLQAETEPALTEIEMQRLQQRCQDWDAFLTFVIKEVAAATDSETLRLTLLDILLDARYQITSILTSNSKSGPDPVKHLFARSWERLAPVMREISHQSPEHNLLPFMSFTTAAEVLEALDRLGPAVGLDISTDGLRRLARLLNDNPALDPLKYPVEIDPVLQQLFDFGIPSETFPRKKPSSFKLQLIRPAYAASRWDRLNRWVPTAADLDAYLPEIRDLLLEEADERLKSSPIAEAHGRVFRHLMLTTAWQESCWRQYIVEKRKIVPLVSGTGDIGMLQINEKVWRGFYSPAKLRWDITYNTRAGSEILFKFMINYALKRQEHKKAGGLTNLARATYSAYNGGPSKVGRYRSKNVPTAHKKIDTAFWIKYKQISQGNEFAVAQCLGGEDPGPAVVPQVKKESKSKFVAKRETSKPRRIENIEWIRKQNAKHFTLQLAAVSSEQAVKNLIEKHTRSGIFSYYRRKHKGRELYIAIYGSFSKRTEAEKAAARFTPLKPWIRDFGSIQATLFK